MCGIVAYVGDRPAIPILMEGLKNLEYRGYDSAGVAFLQDEKLQVIKKKGRLACLTKVLKDKDYLSDNGCATRGEAVHVGIGHTRWATHGAPSDENSHPHLSSNKKICVVHNGIIENYVELRRHLQEKGYKFLSETDTEVFAHLIEDQYACGAKGDLLTAVQMALMEVEGSYALGVLCTDFPDMLIAARKDSPLVVGYGENAHIIASDIPAILDFTRDVKIIHDNEIVVMKKDDVKLYTVHGDLVSRDIMHVDWDKQSAQKGGFEHYMMKEICEEPQAFQATVAPRMRDDDITLEHFPIDADQLRRAKNIHIVACGTAYHAGYVGKYVIEKLCRIPVVVDVASEFRYREPIIDENSIVMIISQSGETLDTLAAMREAKKRGARVLAIVNVIGSTIAREADYVLYTAAGPEISVASTKAFTTQLGCMYLFAIKAAFVLGQIDKKMYGYYQKELLRVPDLIELAIGRKEDVQKIASMHFNADSIFYIGRGLDYALSMEASLKLKEISYIHSEAYPGGELKHGTIALIENGTLVVCPMTQTHLMDKMLSNVQEVRARGAKVMCITYEDNKRAIEACDYAVTIPPLDPLIAPTVAVTSCQLFAYYVAVNKGCDVDKPRNLAKSVTVE